MTSERVSGRNENKRKLQEANYKTHKKNASSGAFFFRKR